MRRIVIGVWVLATVGMASPAQAETTGLEQKIDILSDEVDKLRAQLEKQQARGEGGKSGISTTLGGYGELHYNNLDSGKEIDFHRFVLFVSHRFNERTRFFSELELEHSNTENGGAVELEQAFLEFDLGVKQRVQAGLFILPIGILNETHEPPVFYGVERNPVETNIIPVTWWEGGAGMNGEIGAGLRYDVALTSGLKVPTTGSNAYVMREGRQNVSAANANDPAYTARLRWAGLPGLELAAAMNYQRDITQSAAGIAPISALLTEAHAIYSLGSFTIKGLYARWKLGAGDAATGPATGPAPGKDRQMGWYVEPAYKLSKTWGVFTRYNEWDNSAGSANTTDTKKRQANIGVSYWPHPSVVVKADLQNQRGAINDDGFNVGVGYIF